MSRKKINRNPKTQRIRRERDSIPWRYCFFTLVCGMFLVVGFFGAARQHFASIDYGIKNSKMRKQIEELEADKRRLLLAKEMTLSPAEIKKSAKKMGFQEMTASNIEIYRPTPEKITKEKSLTKRTVDSKPVQAMIGKPNEAVEILKKPKAEAKDKPAPVLISKK